MNEDGESDTMDFSSKEEYISYIRPHGDEEDIQDMVDNFLRKKDKKVYYESLFGTDL